MAVKGNDKGGAWVSVSLPTDCPLTGPPPPPARKWPGGGQYRSPEGEEEEKEKEKGEGEGEGERGTGNFIRNNVHDGGSWLIDS